MSIRIAGISALQGGKLEVQFAIEVCQMDMPGDIFNLERFVEAQIPAYSNVAAEPPAYQFGFLRRRRP